MGSDGRSAAVTSLVESLREVARLRLALDVATAPLSAALSAETEASKTWAAAVYAEAAGRTRAFAPGVEYIVTLDYDGRTVTVDFSITNQSAYADWLQLTDEQRQQLYTYFGS